MLLMAQIQVTYVRDHIPLEQGLRPRTFAIKNWCYLSQRPYSIRTRIKTLVSKYNCITIARQRPYSIRTRIKTMHRSFWTSLRVVVRDHIPLEQGLRPQPPKVIVLLQYVRDHIPLEQGLRLSTCTPVTLFVISQRPYSIRTRIKTVL